MATFRNIRVVVWPDKGWRVQWQIDELDPSDTIVVQRSQGPEGPWTTAGTVSASTMVYEDTDQPYRSYWTLFFYRLQVKRDGSVIATSEPASTSRQASHEIREVIRRYEQVLQGVNGHSGQGSVEMACFKRAIDGTDCPDCVDPKSGQRLVDRCTTCNGTGYVEGWSNPIKFRARFLNGPTKQTRQTQQNEEEEDRRQLWTAAYPVMEPHDVLVEKENGRRWRIIRIDTNEPSGVIVSQMMTVRRIEREFIENDLMYPGES